jgi:hypothetical protein
MPIHVADPEANFSCPVCSESFIERYTPPEEDPEEFRSAQAAFPRCTAAPPLRGTFWSNVMFGLPAPPWAQWYRRGCGMGVAAGPRPGQRPGPSCRGSSSVACALAEERGPRAKPPGRTRLSPASFMSSCGLRWAEEVRNRLCSSCRLCGCACVTLLRVWCADMRGMLFANLISVLRRHQHRAVVRSCSQHHAVCFPCACCSQQLSALRGARQDGEGGLPDDDIDALPKITIDASHPGKQARARVVYVWCVGVSYGLCRGQSAGYLAQFARKPSPLAQNAARCLASTHSTTIASDSG